MSFSFPKNDAPCALAIGFFDGVHIGHQKLLTSLARLSESAGLESVAFAFSNHPATVLAPENAPLLLTEHDEKITLIKKTGVSKALTPEFTLQVAGIEAEDFARLLFTSLNAKMIVLSENFRFGRRAMGDCDTMIRCARQFAASVTVEKMAEYMDSPISSTRIRSCLESGGIAEANAMLGRMYSLRGAVVTGRRLGREIGIPTANIDISANRRLPSDGVYAAFADIGGAIYKSVVNIGFNPTVGGLRRTVEAHIMAFSGDVYGSRCALYFVSRLRGEKRFSSTGELAAQIKSDVCSAESILDATKSAIEV